MPNFAGHEMSGYINRERDRSLHDLNASPEKKEKLENLLLSTEEVMKGNLRTEILSLLGSLEGFDEDYSMSSELRRRVEYAIDELRTAAIHSN